MKIKITTKKNTQGPLVLLVYTEKEKLNPLTECPPDWCAVARSDGFRGDLGETCVTRVEKHQQILWVGLGKKGETPDLFRQAGAVIGKKLQDTPWATASLSIPSRADAEKILAELVEGVLLGTYRFNRFKSQPPASSRFGTLTFLVPITVKNQNIVFHRSTKIAQAVCYARDLINEPPSRKPPHEIGRLAKKLMGQGLSVTVYDKPKLEKMKAMALLGVGRGSAHPPVLIHLCYKPALKTKTKLALVGKGVTFDSGGLSLKPADSMMTMKYDMAGAAVVLALFSVLRELKPAVEVHGVIAVTENMPGPDALKPGDVVRALNGKTIEILNTDAEGRVILADALSYAVRLKPDQIVDVATLTGAVTVALGKAYAALMTDHDDLEKTLKKASEEAGEKLWSLPLEKSYREHIKSKVADIKNIGNPGEAGTITAGLFLQEFAGSGPWAHLDMAGVGWSATGSPLGPAGATGALVRTLLCYLLGTREHQPR